MEELWKKIIGFEKEYEISNLGNVKSLKRWRGNGYSGYFQKERILKPKPCRGYEYVDLSKNGKTHKKQIHRLVAMAFIPNPQNKPQVNHINGVKNDNRVKNLEWCTDLENKRHAIKLGLNKNRGENHYASKLTENDVLKIKRLKNKKTNKELSVLFNVSKSSISLIINNKIWRHIDE